MRKRIVNSRNPFVINWDINSRCTYDCSYCPSSLKDLNNFIYNREDDSEIIEEFLNRLHVNVADRNVHLWLNGGEPTIAPAFDTIVDFGKLHNWSVLVNTNASRSIRWWHQHLSSLYAINISYHPETADESLIDKIKQIQVMGKVSSQDKVNISVFTLMYPPLFDKARKMYEELSKLDNIVLTASRVFKRGDHYDNVHERHRAQQSKREESYNYTAEQEDWLLANSAPIGEWHYGKLSQVEQDRLFGDTYLEEYWPYVSNTDLIPGMLKNKELLFPEDVVNTRKNSFKGWSCNVGLDYLRIEKDGDIYTASCTEQQLISDIKSFKSLPMKPTMCKAKWCMCTAEVAVPKQIGFQT